MPSCFIVGPASARGRFTQRISRLKTAHSQATVTAGRSNFDFEAGNLTDWTAQGDAFKRQPIEGDSVSRRRGDMHSRHQGRFWVGTFESRGRHAQGNTHFRPVPGFQAVRKLPDRGRLASPRPASSSSAAIRARSSFESPATIAKIWNQSWPTCPPTWARISSIRLVDSDSGGWGHINFDDFRLHDTKPDVPPRRRPAAFDTYAHAGLGPEDAARAMTVPPGFKVTLFAGEPDVVQPIAMAIDDRGRIWIAEAYSYPRRVPQAEARDRILIFEDSDGDGRFDSRKVFADHLNLVSGLEVGFGGVWVGAAPEFYFIPDKNGDDRPDGPAQVLLDGWGQHDTHETLNSFTWGPDGWLYGCHGVFTHSRVGKPGTKTADRIPINAGIWRYHPLRHVFEVFASGTSNPWGIDFDARGQMFITACVIPHLYHMIQGGRYERQAGQHFNPYTYDDIKTIADHRHYLGANPHGGNGRSDSAGGGHAHSGALIYPGGAWPAEYNGSLFMNNIHGARLNRDLLIASGSGFVGSHAPDFLLANDVWSQIISLKTGPGRQPLHDRLVRQEPVPPQRRERPRPHQRPHLQGQLRRPQASDSESRRRNIQVAGRAANARRTSGMPATPARILQERGPNAEAAEMLVELRRKSRGNTAVALRALLAQHAVGGLSDPAAIEQASLIQTRRSAPGRFSWRRSRGPLPRRS